MQNIITYDNWRTNYLVDVKGASDNEWRKFYREKI